MNHLHLASLTSQDLSEDVLKRNTQNVIALLKHWQLKNEEECELLGGISPAQLAKLKEEQHIYLAEIRSNG